MNYRIVLYVLLSYLVFMCFIVGIYFMSAKENADNFQFERWKTHYDVDVNFLDKTIQPLDPYRGNSVAGVDIQLFDAIQSERFKIFDGVFYDEDKKTLRINFIIPNNININERQLYMYLQSVNFAVIVNKLYPNMFNDIVFTVFDRSQSKTFEISYSKSINDLLLISKSDYLKVAWKEHQKGIV